MKKAFSLVLLCSFNFITSQTTEGSDISGHSDPEKNGVYNLVYWNYPNLPGQCSSTCTYEKEGDTSGQKYCMAESMNSQSECLASEGFAFCLGSCDPFNKCWWC